MKLSENVIIVIILASSFFWAGIFSHSDSLHVIIHLVWQAALRTLLDVKISILESDSRRGPDSIFIKLVYLGLSV